MTEKPSDKVSAQRMPAPGTGMGGQTPPYHVLKTFFDSSPDMLCVVGVDGYFRVINPAFENLLGHTRQVLFETPFVEFVHPEDKAGAMAATTANTRESVTRFENRYRCGDGSYKWLAWALLPVAEEERIYAIARDISGARTSEWEKKKQGALFETVLANVPASIFWKDRNSVFLGANKRFAQDAGLRHPGELIGTTDYDLACTQEEADFYRQCDREVMDSGQPLLNIRSHDNRLMASRCIS